MAASTAIIGYGSILEVEDAPASGIYVTLAEVTNLEKPNASVDEVEVTHMASPGRAKEFIAGLADYGELNVDINWVPSNATDAFIEAWRLSGLNRATRITYPNAAKDTFQAFVKSYSGAVPVSDRLTAQVGLRLSGAPVRS